MKLSHLTPVQVLEIRAPRWHDRKVLIAKYKVGTHNKIIFTDAPSLEGEFYLSGSRAQRCPLVSNGKLICYAVPLDDLEPLEREEF